MTTLAGDKARRSTTRTHSHGQPHRRRRTARPPELNSAPLAHNSAMVASGSSTMNLIAYAWVRCPLAPLRLRQTAWDGLDVWSRVNSVWRCSRQTTIDRDRLQEPVEHADRRWCARAGTVPMTRTASRPYAERSAFVGGRDEPEQQLGAGVVQRCEAGLEPGALRSHPSP